MPPVRQADRPRAYTSRCGEIILRGTPQQVAQKYEEMAGQAMRDKDRVLAETYHQHAHHWRGV